MGKRGRTTIGWEPILNCGLTSDAPAMNWKGGGKEAASQGRDGVMTRTTIVTLIITNQAMSQGGGQIITDRTESIALPAGRGF
jgi:hypothetical protein